MIALVQYALAVAFAPLLLGVINRVKAAFAGRRGQPLLQPYHDLARLLRKGTVVSPVTSWVFRMGPTVGLAAVLAALAVVPLGPAGAVWAFPGDVVLLAYLLGLQRFVTVAAALDTGSAFEGMGASREVQFAALAEPAFLAAVAALALHTPTLSLTPMLGGLKGDVGSWPAQLLAAGALYLVFLCENARIPVDDPNTHLELTMIHEVMVLDHAGPDLAFIEYAAALKLWLLGALVVGVLVPVAGMPVGLGLLAMGAGIVAIAALTGVVESTIARLRLASVPKLLASAMVLAVLALVAVVR